MHRNFYNTLEIKDMKSGHEISICPRLSMYQSISKMNANSDRFFYKKISKFKGKIAQEYKIM